MKKNVVPSIFATSLPFGLSTSHRKLESHCNLQHPITTMSLEEKVAHDHSYCQSSTTIDNIHKNDIPDLQIKLKR